MRVKSKVYPALLVLGALVSHASAFAENPAIPAHTKLPAIAAERKDQFIDALLKDQPLSVSPREGEPKVEDASLRDVWLGNDPEMDATLDNILLTFTQQASERSKGRKFELSVRFEGDYFFVRTSLPASREYEGGLRISMRGSKPRKILMQGYGMSGVIVAVPPMTDVGLRGALICPQDFVREDRVIKSPILVDTGFRVTSVQLSAAAHIEGRVLTGSAIGFAQASVSTSEHIPNEGTYYDISYAKDPHVGVNYLPEGEAPVIPIDASIGGIEGIELRLDMQTAAGYKRSTYLAESLSIEPYTQERSFPIHFLKHDFVVRTVNCVLLLQQRRLEERYSKEAFVLPENLRKEFQD